MRSRSRVVVLGRDESFLRLLRTLLGEIGVEVVTHPDGWAPVRVISRLQPDLLILDIALGHDRLDWAILESLAEHPATRHIPVLVCSAADWLLGERRDMLQRDGISTWSAPYDLCDLISAVAKARRPEGTAGAAIDAQQRD